MSTRSPTTDSRPAHDLTFGALMTTIHIESLVHVPLPTVWQIYNTPEHITQWNAASPDWHTPSASNDLRVGGRYHARMEARDGSMGFDLTATYLAVDDDHSFTYEMEDGRRVTAAFEERGPDTLVSIDFDAEAENSVEDQRAGWQAILDSYTRYAEGL
ncbi:SRPBCC domain-containing protein [Actinomyces urogenitalis]|uniref:SRPBCC domain-containing protein n=1 Tax=Actinomyces urogenitalis TaxID=103621 RepID=UPI00242AA422|nr:SRPBCC domain-containing protein [Actinomyces urogenitalis]MCI7455988.1 SRPBCC domain-containing protein [Actinomyces urogenitalis]